MLLIKRGFHGSTQGSKMAARCVGDLSKLVYTTIYGNYGTILMYITSHHLMSYTEELQAFMLPGLQTLP